MICSELSARTKRKNSVKQEDTLVELLSEKDLPAKEIESRFKKLGISYRTVTEAKRALGIRSYRSGNQSVWSLPEELCNNADVAVGFYE